LINVFALRKQNLIGRVCALPVRTQQTDERRRPAQPVVEAFIFSDIVNLLFSIHPSSHPAGKKKKEPSRPYCIKRVIMIETLYLLSRVWVFQIFVFFPPKEIGQTVSMFFQTPFLSFSIIST
jgi:hypothetical protein